MSAGASRGTRVLRLLVLLLGSVPIVAPLFAHPWFDSHEAASYLARVVEVRECWNDGMWSARWFPDLAGGRGYPFLSFYAPATFWVAGAVSLFSSVVSAWKIVVIAATCAGLTGAYRLAREGMSPLAAMVAAWFYAYAPYHLRDLWTRGDLAEYAAMGLLPWALFFVLRMRRIADPISTVGAGLVVAGLALTHNALALLAVPALGVAAACAFFFPDELNRRTILTSVFVASLVALGTSAFFWWPALSERSWVHLENLRSGHFDFRRNFVALHEFFAFTRPARAFVAGRAEPLTFELGTALIPALLAPFVVRAARVRPIVVLGVALSIASIAACVRASLPLYESVPLLGFLGFPWRFLAIASLGVALLAGAGASLILDRWGMQLFATALFAALAIAPVRDLLGPTAPLELKPWMLDPVAYRAADFTASVADEYVPIWAVRDEAIPFQDGLAATHPVRFSSVERSATHWRFATDAPTATAVVLRRYFYPGWRGRIDGHAVEVRPREGSGYSQLSCPAGAHTVEVIFAPTRERVIARGVSVASLFGALAFVGLSGRRSGSKRAHDDSVESA